MFATTRTRLSLVAIAALVFGLVMGTGSVSADTVESARGAAFGVQLQGPAGLGPEPTVEAAVPPGPDEHAEDSVVEVPADPLATSFTAHVEADASLESTIDATLQDTLGAGAPTKWNARGYAITEDLEALADNLTADVIEAEALAACENGEIVFGAAARIVNLSVGGTAIPVINPTPNQVVFDQGGIRIVAFETNADGEGGTTDGSDVVFVNALHITAPGGVDLVVSHAEAEGVCAEVEDLKECEDGIDNDGDGEIDFPNDPGCDSPKDDDERDEDLNECEDGIDNDGDGEIDFPNDPGCDSPKDDDERDDLNECEDGIDNDGDGVIDFPNDPGCVSTDDDDETDPAVAPPADPVDAQPSFTG